MCLICCGPPKAPDEDCPEWDESLRALPAESLEWLNHYVGITNTEELIPLGAYLNFSNFAIDDYKGKSSSFGCATYFRTPEGIPWDDTDGPHGLTCHEKCYKLLQQELLYTLKFRDVWPLLMQQEFPTAWLDLDVTDYGGMAAYAGEFFRYQEMCADGNAWMLRDPTVEKANAERILKIWKALIEKGLSVSTAPEDEERGGGDWEEVALRLEAMAAQE